MTMDRLRNLGFVLAFLTLGLVLFSLYAAFRTAIENGNWVAFLGGILLGALMVGILLKVMVVPDRRSTGWVRSITSINAKYLFGTLIVVWAVAMSVLASLNLETTVIGAPALVGLFFGVFIFMGFIWAVIGE